MSSLFSSGSTSAVKRPRRTLVWLLPILIVLIIGGLFVATSWKKLMPAVEVDVIRARMGEAAVTVAEGETLFQAAGWIEPDPFPVRATALVSGIVKKVHIIEGQKVKKGDVLAELIDDDLKLALSEAEAKLEELKLTKKRHQIEIKTHMAQIEEIASRQKSAEAIAATARHKADILNESKFAIPKFDKEQAELEYKEKAATVKEFDSQKKIHHMRIDLVENNVVAAEAAITRQKVIIEKIKLDLSRTVIKSPVDGMIMHVYAIEGRKQMLGSDNDKSTTIASIFNPEKIQVRVDIPLSDVDKLKVGLKAKIHVEFLKDSLPGHVTSISGYADYQKNTLEAKVTIPGGHESLRPDMLAQVEFISDSPEPSKEKETVSGIFVRKDAIIEGSKVWVYSSDDTAKMKTVEVGKNEKEGWVEIKSGVNPGEKLIVNPPAALKEGNNLKQGKIHE